nr:f-box/fbd/lrr-repeat protein [Quercus suber]
MAERETLSPGKDAVVDRISSLPESLLCYVLSFLPTKESIATSILSTRWKLLWTLVPKLDLDTYTISTSELWADDDVEDALPHVVSSVLAQQQCGELQTFRLIWAYWRDGSHLDAWLRTAAARKVKELNLHIYSDREENPKLPPSFFSCRTLVVLKLDGDIDFDIDIDTPSLSFNFPSLKILHLLAMGLPCPLWLKLLSGCPVLEDFSFTTEYFYEGEYKICVPTLKRLSIREFYFTDDDFELEINAPALEYFELYEFCRKWLFNLFAALNNVKFLSFSTSGTEWHKFGNIYPSSFQNLVKLIFKVNGCSWNMLRDLLQKAPNLETLVITKVCDFVESNLHWKEPQYDPANLSSLTSFYYRRFKGESRRKVFLRNYQCSQGAQQHAYLELNEVSVWLHLHGTSFHAYLPSFVCLI